LDIKLYVGDGHVVHFNPTNLEEKVPILEKELFFQAVVPRALSKQLTVPFEEVP
jgi:hypothetical protein